VSWRPTALNVSFLTLIGWALFLGILTGRADVIVVAVPLVVALVAGRLAKVSPALQIDHELSAERVFEGERVTVTVTLRTKTRVPLVEVLEPLPARAHLEHGRNHAFFSLQPDQ
jgi:uncharacterized protein (DUF58 family)